MHVVGYLARTHHPPVCGFLSKFEFFLGSGRATSRACVETRLAVTTIMLTFDLSFVGSTNQKAAVRLFSSIALKKTRWSGHSVGFLTISQVVSKGALFSAPPQQLLIFTTSGDKTQLKAGHETLATAIFRGLMRHSSTGSEGKCHSTNLVSLLAWYSIVARSISRRASASSLPGANTRLQDHAG